MSKKFVNSTDSMRLVNQMKNEGYANIDQVLKAMSQNTVGVKFTSGRGKMKTSIDTKSLGIKLEDDENKKFMANNIDTGRIYFFPKTYERKLDKIVARIRRHIERKTLAPAFNGYLVTMDVFEEIKEAFENAQEEYEQECELIVQNMDVFKADFEMQIHKMFDELDPENKEKVISSLVAQFPTAEEFQRKFYFNMIPMIYPLVADIENSPFANSDEDVKNEIAMTQTANSVDIFYDMVATTLCNLSERTQKLYKQLLASDEKEVKEKSRTALKDAIKVAKENNHFIKHPQITDVITALEKVYVKQESIDAPNNNVAISNSEISQYTEQILGHIYCYLDSIGKEDKVVIEKDLPLDYATLKFLGADGLKGII